MTELWDIYDSTRQKTGKTKTRGTEFQPGEFHLVVHVCLFNGRGELLIQQRQTFKEGWPGMWDLSVGGSALAGESSLQAAVREAREEIGYRKDMNGLRPHLTVNFEQGFDDFYLVIDRALNLDELDLQEEEVKDVRWASREEIHGMRNESLFVPYHEGLIDTIFQMKESRGAIIG